MKNKIIYDFSPYWGLGSFLFGLDRKLIRERLGIPFREIVKGSIGAQSAFDVFDEVLFAEYDNNNSCNAVEFICDERLGKNSYDIMFQNNNLSTLSFKEFEKRYSIGDNSTKIDEDSLICYSWGFSIWCPDYLENKLSRPRSILFFEKGYWDRISL